MLSSIFLTFSNAGGSYSIDRWLAERKQDLGNLLACPWGQRMLQVQLAITYCGAFCFKIADKNWLDGSAVYYSTRMEALTNNSLPLLDQMWFCRVSSWFTLLVELLAWTLIWYKPARPYLLSALVVMHLGIDFVFTLPIFQWLFVCTLITFVEPETVKAVVSGVLRRLGFFNSSRTSTGTIDTVAQAHADTAAQAPVSAEQKSYIGCAK